MLLLQTNLTNKPYKLFGHSQYTLLPHPTVFPQGRQFCLIESQTDQSHKEQLSLEPKETFKSV